ncbi:MAG TPA: hypothetical protein DIU15_00860 [Deltaproteobacteria bacterium]|nr:hypothetical protein [Deltaproteobacteria bacterium]HCP44578.1 hypothetical protein [Deltaproteobacteria bacterium]
MPWNRDRILVLLSGAIFLFFGAWLFTIPTALEGIGIQLTTQEAVIDVRATYGGLELGLAAFFFIAQGKPSWYRPSLFAAALAIAGFGACRLLGMALAAEAPPLMVFFFVIEVVAASVLIWAYRTTEAPE